MSISYAHVNKATAIDLGPAGPDLDFGYGRADALAAIQSLAPVLYASVLPGSRSVRVGTTATAFTTIINAGTAPAVGCGIAPITGVPAIFLYQTTAPATNQPSGAANTPANIAVGGFQTYLVAFTPTAPFSPTEVQLSFSCA